MADSKDTAGSKSKSKKSGEYSADSISILEGLEAVRKRPVCTSDPPANVAYTI